MSDTKSPYGEWCPSCGAPIRSVTRGIPSMGTCANGHTTDRRDTLRRQPPPPKTYTEAEVQALVAAAVMEAAEWLQSQCLTEDELRQGYLFTAEYPAKAADTIRNMFIRPDAMSALEAYRDREVAKALAQVGKKE